MESWLKLLVDQAGGLEAVRCQSIGWKPAAWDQVAAVSSEAATAVSTLAELAPTSIQRNHVRAVGIAAGPVAEFVAAMIWGFGLTPYGPHRLVGMLTESRDDQPPLMTIEQIMGTAQRKGAAAGFGALWRNGRSRVYGLGIAFGTKALYFAADDGTPGPRPLVLDQFVYAGTQRLIETNQILLGAPVPDPRRYLTSQRYEDYCKWAADILEDPTVAAELVEFVLFQLGKGAITLKG
jgi:hypothetical protein